MNAVVVQWLVEENLPSFDVRGHAMAEILLANGFTYDGGPLSGREGLSLVHDTMRTLKCLNLFVKSGVLSESKESTDAGQEFLLEIQRKQHRRPS